MDNINNNEEVEEYIPKDPSILMDHFLFMNKALDNIEKNGRLLGHILTPVPYDDEIEEENSFQKLLNKMNEEIPFLVSGKLELKEQEKMIPIYVKEELVGTLANLNIEKLSSFAIPSPFGHLQKLETIIDENVRKALEIPMDFVKFGITKQKQIEKKHNNNINEEEEEEKIVSQRVIDIDYDFMNDLLHFITFKIEDELDTKILLQPYKLNIYKEGDFFKPHVDTPINENMIGSLVICLPNSFLGGELIIQNNSDQKEIIDFSKYNDEINWVAFYSDCIHEVKPILKGNRITLTFSILKTQEVKDYTISEFFDEYRPNSINTFKKEKYSKQEKEKSIIDAYEIILKECNPIGIVLGHEYTLNGLKKENLKGIDKILYDIFSKNNEIELKNVVSSYKEEKDCSEGSIEELKEFIYHFDYQDILDLNQGKIMKRKQSESKLYTFFEIYGGGNELRKIEDEGAAYTGNESRNGSIDIIYFKSVLLIN